MQAHIYQASHNLNFVNDCCQSYPDSYFDWKVTATFYTALHLIRALCSKRGVNPGRTHHDIATSLDPKRKTKKITQIPQWVWDKYNTLQRYSEQARYDGFLDPEIENEIQKENYFHVCDILESLEIYFTKQGIQRDKAA